MSFLHRAFTKSHIPQLFTILLWNFDNIVFYVLMESIKIRIMLMCNFGDILDTIRKLNHKVFFTCLQDLHS